MRNNLLKILGRIVALKVSCDDPSHTKYKIFALVATDQDEAWFNKFTEGLAEECYLNKVRDLKAGNFEDE